MKNTILSLAAMLLIGQTTTAQNYVSMAQPGTTWLYESIGANSGGSSAVQTQYMISGDTTVDGKPYKKIIQRTHGVSAPASQPQLNFLPRGNKIATLPDILFGIIRDDNGKIYMRHAYSPVGTDSLSFDFNLGVGDTTPTGMEITAVDTVSINGNYRKRQIINANLAYIEGVGMEQEGLFILTPVAGGGSYTRNFICYSDNSEPYPVISSCFYLWENTTPTSVLTQPTENADIKTYPNPFSNELVIDSKVKGNVTLVNAMGQQVMKQTLTGLRTVLSTTGLSTGVYSLVLYSEQGEVIRKEKLVKQ